MPADKTVKIINREHWLTEMARLTEPLFKGFRLSPYRVTCGWPCVSPLSPTRKRIGECHGAKCSKDGHHELFISPLLEKVDDVAGTLVHELAHVAAGLEAGHGKGYVRVAHHVGLTKGKPASMGPGPLLEDKLRRWAESLGKYPHAALVPLKKASKKGPGNHRLECVQCGCVVMISNKWMGEAGAPTCACGGEMLTEVEEEEDS